MREGLKDSIFSVYSRLNADFYNSESWEEQVNVEFFVNGPASVADNVPKYNLCYQSAAKRLRTEIFLNS